MANNSNHPHNPGNTPMLCKRRGCKHKSRDHARSHKQPDGSWNGPCRNCDCKLYLKPKFLQEI